MAEIPFPPVDYTSRDYTSLREDMLAGIPSRVPEWTTRNQNDFGIALIELFAYMGDGLHYYADRIANESMLATATQRRSVLNHARLLDYTPRDGLAATVALVFTNANSSAALIPAGTRASTMSIDNGKTPTVYYETTVDLTVPANDTAAVTAVEGVAVASEQIGISSGDFDQDFTLFNSPVISGSVHVVVSEGVPVEWTYFSHLIDAGPDERAYTLQTDDRGITHVVFGDGANGKIPSVGAVARASYRVGGGERGNVGPGQITRIVTTVPAGVTVTSQDAAIGGADPETMTEIKVNAPRSLFTLGRAVSLDDYANLAIQVPTVSKAQAVASVPRSVTIYVGPAGGGGYAADGITPTPQLATAMADLTTFLAGKTAPGTTVTVHGPDYIPVNVTLTVNVRPEFRQDAVRQSVLAALTLLFDYDNVIFGDRFTPGDIYTLLSELAGIAYGEGVAVDRDTTVFTDPDPTSADAVMRLNEIPVLGAVTLNLLGGIAG